MADSSTSNFEALLPLAWKDTIRKWIDDDVPTFDIGGFVVGDAIEEATLLGKSAGILAGRPFFQGKLHSLDPALQLFHANCRGV